MAKLPEKPVTLGDKVRLRMSDRASGLWHPLLVSPIVGALLWWGVQSFELAIGSAIFVAACLALRRRSRALAKNHFLIAHDRQGFMPALKLADKTAVFDGNNIYHFGRERGFGTKVLRTLVRKLRAEGFRVVCFFDANIYFTLLENGEFQKGRERFSVGILRNLFGLREDEIYVVPNGRQADEFILESLDLLPISFAVTNDRFRDFEARYDFLREGKDWRKGVAVKNGDVLLHNHRFRGSG